MKGREANDHAMDVSAPSVLHKLFQHFRTKRMRLFERTLQVSNRTRVLDLGGGSSIWQFASVQPRLTILNLPGAEERMSRRIDWVIGDGRMLPFRDGSFDVVFSNSVIEHVGTRAEQQRFADEIARVGRRYWIQTPNRRFPIELHLMLPLIHFLPKSWQRRIVNRFTVWERLTHPSEPVRAFYLHHFLNELNLLDQGELSKLFPDATVIVERVLGIPKSLIAVRR